MRPQRGQSAVSNSLLLNGDKMTQFKRGDTIVSVSIWSSERPAIVETTYRLTSLGKKQGTAIRVSDGSNALHRFYVDWMDNVYLAGDDEKRRELRARAMQNWVDEKKREIECCAASRHLLRPEYVAKHDAEQAKRKSMLNVEAHDFDIVQR